MTRAEPVALVKQTIESLLAIKEVGDEILIIDNNHKDKKLYQPLQRYCDALDDSLKVRFYHKDFIAGYKAGALNYALNVMDKACHYIVVVDSDYQALPWARTSIARAINKYPNHALLQYPQYYRDSNKPDIHSELNHYFSRLLKTKNNQQRSLSTGTFAVIKKEALHRMGGWSGESITEDAQMGVLLHLQGERTQYIPKVIATGVLPSTLEDLMNQRRRWIYGNMQVLAKYPKMLLRRLQDNLIEKKSSILQAKKFESVSTKTSTVNVKPSSSFNLNYIRAHISQLGAWVNLTGIFIVIHGLCLAMLVVIKVFGLQHLLTPVLSILTVCYVSYGIFMGRKLVAFLSDNKPLLTPQGTRLNVYSEMRFNVPSNNRFGYSDSSNSSRTSRNHCFYSQSFYSGTFYDELRRQPLKDISIPLKSRLKAWLVHLNFWEMGALSWLPVLWNQQKPFICTPKFNLKKADKRPYLHSFRVLPKALIAVNMLTAIIVLPYSYALGGAAVGVLSIKLLASWVMIKNFDSRYDHTAKKAKYNQPQDTDNTNYQDKWIQVNSAVNDEVVCNKPTQTAPFKNFFATSQATTRYKRFDSLLNIKILGNFSASKYFRASKRAIDIIGWGRYDNSNVGDVSSVELNSQQVNVSKKII